MPSAMLHRFDRWIRRLETQFALTPQEKLEIALRAYEHKKIELEHELTETQCKLTAANEHIARCRMQLGLDDDTNVLHIIRRAAANQS